MYLKYFYKRPENKIKNLLLLFFLKFKFYFFYLKRIKVVLKKSIMRVAQDKIDKDLQCPLRPSFSG